MSKYQQRIRFTVVALAFIAGLLSFTWSGDYIVKAQQAATVVLHEDFEDDAIGPLGSPWTISSAGSGSVSIVNTTDHGHVLKLLGSKTEGHFLIASRAISSSATEIITEVDIRPATNATFIWSLHGAGSSIGARRIRLQRQPGSTMLVSHTVPGGNRNCAPLPSNVWSRVTLKVHAGALPHTFDVLINGNPTACTGLSTGLSKPFTKISVMDASNLSWGGDVRFDNIDISTP
jgi:hypothetical protein